MKQNDQRPTTDGAACASIGGHESTSVERRYVTESELAARWQISVKTLQRWRATGTKPAFSKFLKTVRYPMHGLDGVLDMERVTMPPPASGHDRG